MLVSGSILTASDVLGRPHKVHVLNDSLIVVLDDTQSYIHLISRRNGSVLTSFGVGGSGPGEYSAAELVVPDILSSERFWVDPIRGAMHRYQVARVADGPDSSITFPGDMRRMTATVWYADTVVAGLSRRESKAVTSWRVGADTFQRYGQGVKLNRVNVDSLAPITRSQLAGNIRGCFERERNAFVRVYRESGRVEIVSAVSGAANTAAAPMIFDEALFRDPDLGWGLGIASARDQRVAYQGCATTAKYIFALFSGRRFKQFGIEEARNCHYVHVFTWDGKLHRVLELKEPIVNLAIDSESLELYGVRTSPRPSVVQFSLAQHLK